jgi:hypothetical protein
MDKITIIIIVVVVLCCCSIVFGYVHFKMQSNNKNTTNKGKSASTNKKNSENTSSNMQGNQSSNMQGNQSQNMQGNQSPNMQGNQSQNMQGNQSPNMQSNQQVFTTQPIVTSVPRKVTFYEHCNYEGRSWDLDEGEFSWVENVGIPNDLISSVKVPPGMQVILYEHSNFDGRQLILTNDEPCLVGKEFNDHTSSIRIRRV